MTVGSHHRTQKVDRILALANVTVIAKRNNCFASVFTCVSYAEARNRYRLSVRPSVRHTLVLYQNG